MISIIVPVYNEVRIISRNIGRLRHFMDNSGLDYEMIIAEDGSTDGTREAVEKMAAPRMRCLVSEKRMGRGHSLNRAISAAKGGIVVYMDADLATDLDYLKPLVREIENGSIIATGSRLMPNSRLGRRSHLRNLLSQGYNLMLRRFFGSMIYDHQCGFKAFKKPEILALLKRVKDNHWFWDSEVLLIAQSDGLKVSEIPVSWTDRPDSSVNLYSDVFNMGLAALSLRLRTLFSRGQPPQA